jgi:hypothetical protein
MPKTSEKTVVKLEVIGKSKRVRCPRCGYEWNLRGDVPPKTCTRCQVSVVGLEDQEES